MNIIFVANNYVEHGGFHNYLYRVTQSLKEMGHGVAIIKCGAKNIHKYVGAVEVWEIAVPNFNSSNQCINTFCNMFWSSKCVNKKIREIKKKVRLISYNLLH